MPQKYAQKEKRKVPSRTHYQLKVLKPKTKNQHKYLQTLLDADLPINFAVGPAGTGKTALCVYAAAKALYDGTVHQVVLTRPVVEAGGENLGFLPGTLEDKIDPYMQPLYDAFKQCFSKNTVKDLISEGKIKVAPIAYMRGITFKKSFVILDEAQNATREQVKLVLTRLGYGSKIVVTGDIGQSDLSDNQSGLAFWANLLVDEPYVSVAELTHADNQRIPEVAALLRKYEEAK